MAKTITSKKSEVTEIQNKLFDRLNSILVDSGVQPPSLRVDIHDILPEQIYVNIEGSCITSSQMRKITSEFNTCYMSKFGLVLSD